MDKKILSIWFFSVILLASGLPLSQVYAEEHLLIYVDNIRSLLEQARQKYAAGDVEEAKRLAMVAYIDNYEYLEDPVEEQNEELNDELEIMLREELQALMRNSAPSSEVDAKIDTILERIDAVAVIVPEFGPIVFLILTVSIVVTVILGIKNQKLRNLS